MKKKKELIIGVLLVIFGVFVILLAMSLFSSDSSWGSVYSIIGVIISTVGVSILTKRFSLPKRIIIDISYFVLFILLLILIDYLGVININQAPRFAHFKANGEFFDTLFYDVIRCDIDTKYESYYVVDNMKYDGDLVNEYCFSKTEKRFDDLIKYVEEHANGISIGMMVDSVDSDGNSMYIRSIDNRTYEVLKFVDNKKEIHEIIEILKKAKYERLSNLMGYSILFQIYENDKLLLEFDRGQIKTKDDYIYVYFENSDAELLKSYYK